jgi:hypothetical protein
MRQRSAALEGGVPFQDSEHIERHHRAEHFSHLQQLITVVERADQLVVVLPRAIASVFLS